MLSHSLLYAGIVVLFLGCSDQSGDSNTSPPISNEPIQLNLDSPTTADISINQGMALRGGFQYSIRKPFSLSNDAKTGASIQVHSSVAVCAGETRTAGPFFTVSGSQKVIFTNEPDLDRNAPENSIATSKEIFEMEPGEYQVELVYFATAPCESVSVSFSIEKQEIPASPEIKLPFEEPNPPVTEKPQAPVRPACTDADTISPNITSELIGGQGGMNGASWFTKNRSLNPALSSMQAPTSQPSIYESFTGDRTIVSSPALTPDGSVFVGDSNQNVYWVKEGRSMHSLWLGCGIGTSNPAVLPDGTVVAGCHRGAVNWLKNGAVVRRFRSDGEFWHSSPAVLADGTIVIGGSDGVVYWLKDAKKIYEFKTGGPVRSSPSIMADGTVIVGSDDGNVYWLKDGVKRCQFTTMGKVSSSAAILSDGTAVIGSEDRNVYWLNRYGEVSAKYATGDAVISSPTLLADETVVVGSNDRYLYWLKDGILKHKFGTLRNYLRGSAVVLSDSTVVIVSEDYRVYWLKNGEMSFSLEYAMGTFSGPSPLVLPNGSLAIPGNSKLTWVR